MSYRSSPWALWAYNSECGTSLHNSNSVGGRCGRDRHGSGCKAFESHDFELGPVRYQCTAPPRSLPRSTAGYLAKRDKMELRLMLTPTQSPCVGRHLGGTAKCPRCDADGGDHLAVEVTVIGTQLAQQDEDRTCTETGSATLHMRLADRFPFEAGRCPALRESCEPSDRAMPSRRNVFSGCCLVWAVKRAWSSYAPAHRWRKKVTIKDSVQSCRVCPKRRQCGQKRLGQISESTQGECDLYSSGGMSAVPGQRQA